MDFIESICFDDLMCDDDSVFGAEVDAFLCLLHSADQTSGQSKTLHNHRHLRKIVRRFRDSQLNHDSVGVEQSEIARGLRGEQMW